MEFLEVEPGRFEVVAATRSVTELQGMFGKAGKTVSIEETNRTIAAWGHLLDDWPRYERAHSLHHATPSMRSERFLSARTFPDAADFNVILNLIELITLRNPRSRETFSQTRSETLHMLGDGRGGPVGFGQKNTEVFVPLGREVGLYGTFEGPLPLVVNLKAEAVAAMNTRSGANQLSPSQTAGF